MTRLILIRHAESGWDDPTADDHARVLTPRGRNEATAIGDWLAHSGYLPDVILSSDAARTIETTELVINALKSQTPVVLAQMLYHASPDTIAEQVDARAEGVIAVVAHNPGICMLADGLLVKRPAHRRFADYPPCATTVIDFDGPIRPNCGTIMEFVVPKDLDTTLF